MMRVPSSGTAIAGAVNSAASRRQTNWRVDFRDMALDFYRQKTPMVKKPGIPIKVCNSTLDPEMNLVVVAGHFPIEYALHRVEVQIVSFALVTIVFVRGLDLIDDRL